ncbi:hypothetical protein BS78_K269400 [Paspalum vaginatum]|uniref:Uncharacterized protein n=1 Tax=Paspalum vaginatum TaxID=158149 RepID=A0A9W7XBF6_9POAL|nr:hypothetical protein BS78_K269400 [Paspalum vaginatum]
MLKDEDPFSMLLKWPTIWVVINCWKMVHAIILAKEEEWTILVFTNQALFAPGHHALVLMSFLMNLMLSMVVHPCVLVNQLFSDPASEEHLQEQPIV